MDKKVVAAGTKGSEVEKILARKTDREDFVIIDTGSPISVIPHFICELGEMQNCRRNKIMETIKQ